MAWCLIKQRIVFIVWDLVKHTYIWHLHFIEHYLCLKMFQIRRSIFYVTCYFFYDEPLVSRDSLLSIVTRLRPGRLEFDSRRR